MKKNLFVLYILFLVSYCSFSQSVGIGTSTPDTSAALGIINTNKGLLVKGMTTTAINTIPDPVRGLLIYDSLANHSIVNTGTPVGPNWQPLESNNVVDEALPIIMESIRRSIISTKDNLPLRFRGNNLHVWN